MINQRLTVESDHKGTMIFYDRFINRLIGTLRNEVALTNHFYFTLKYGALIFEICAIVMINLAQIICALEYKNMCFGICALEYMYVKIEIFLELLLRFNATPKSMI